MTPHEYQEAIEQETDPAPAAVAATRDLITGKQVRAMVYNVQTEDNTSKELRAQAEAADIPVVEVTETLPAGVDYVTWQTDNARAIASALG